MSFLLVILSIFSLHATEVSDEYHMAAQYLLTIAKFEKKLWPIGEIEIYQAGSEVQLRTVSTDIPTYRDYICEGTIHKVEATYIYDYNCKPQYITEAPDLEGSVEFNPNTFRPYFR